MSRTTRTIASAGLVAIASLGVIAVPAHASKTDVTETVTANWEIAGALPGAPGNVHSGSVQLQSGIALDGTRSYFAFVSASDFQCPEGVTTANDGECTWLRGTSSMGHDPAATLATDRGFTTGSGTATIDGYWSLGTGGSTDEVFDFDLDFTGMGPVTRDVHRQTWADGSKHLVVDESRAGTLSGTVAGMTLSNITAEFERQTRP